MPWPKAWSTKGIKTLKRNHDLVPNNDDVIVVGRRGHFSEWSCWDILDSQEITSVLLLGFLLIPWWILSPVFMFFLPWYCLVLQKRKRNFHSLFKNTELRNNCIWCLWLKCPLLVWCRSVIKMFFLVRPCWGLWWFYAVMGKKGNKHFA